MDCLGIQNAPDALIAEQVRTDRLQQLFRQSVYAVAGSYIAAIMLCWLCWGHLEPAVAIAWLSLLTGSTLLRISVFVAYFCSPGNERTPQRWERRYWVTLVLSASVWGAGALAVMPTTDLLTQALVMLFAVGMSVAAVSCYSAYRYMTLVSMALVLLPCSLWLLFQPSPMQVGMALSAMIFAGFVVSATRTLSDALERAFRLTREMERAHSISTYAAQTDELTGLKNRRAFFEAGHQLYGDCFQARRPLCALMLDMDHFKHINDTHGHQVGDNVLRQIGGVIAKTFRGSDVHGRLGGEEFAVLLPDTSLDVALDIAEQLVRTLAGLSSPPVERMTASIGVAVTAASDKDLFHLMNRADKALFRAKALGRNRVAIAE
jgi:diguanylate cyclase (GGDEF)-like protein